MKIIKEQWTASKARLRLVREAEGGEFNWLFLPGGPGLGSESLYGLVEGLSLPGKVWLLDLPGDGSNVTDNDEVAFSHWQVGLVEAVASLSKVILVAHSSGGMFALATKALENKLCGLILMDSAPNASWQNHFSDYVAQHPIPEVASLQEQYTQHPSNATLKTLTLACAPYFSMKSHQAAMMTLMSTLPFNYKTHQWAEKHFDATYQACWDPQTIPVLIFAGEYDVITPLHLFIHSPEFQRENIVIVEIKNASHFPWMENPTQVKAEFERYGERLAKYMRNGP